ncbi:hypothetical protein KJ359_002681 [Pestalotiopsis sp. 9143b]|nr:hypothetical protein KJ359_002681 [Pestalotiopsis sp. 9143b]
MAACFVDLPVELQHSIFRLLDPVALISFAQTNRRFRAAISPKRENFAERLLVLECHEEFGGPYLRFNGLDNHQDPAWDDERADRMRWACSHCLRLLPHRSFDNHSLLRLAFRKPSLEWPAAQICTSWEPTGKVAPRAVLKRRAIAARERLRGLRLDYATGETDERYLCGFRRHQRKCNECRFQTGDLRSHLVIPPRNVGLVPYTAGANIGTASVPIVRSRRLALASYVHRYFPGLFMDLPSYSPLADKAPTFPIYRQDARDRWFTHYMIRCPGCASWKELAAFRIGNHWPMWWPAWRHRWAPAPGEITWENWDGRKMDEQFINDLRCHACLAAVSGRAHLTKALLEWYSDFLLAGLWRAQNCLAMGWGLLYRAAMDGPERNTEYTVPQRYKFEVLSQVLAGLPWEDPDDKRKGVSVVHANAGMLRTMNEKHKVLTKNWDTWFIPNTEEYSHPTEFNNWVNSWVKGYDNLEAQVLWFRACRDEIRGNGSNGAAAVLQWALGGEMDLEEVSNVDGNAIWRERAASLGQKWSSTDIAELG